MMLDFGIAKRGGATFDPTSGGHVIGTPRYLAPEQVLGGHVDARTDVYAMGLCVYEAIAGRGPFETMDPFEIMHAHLDVTPKRLGERAAVEPFLDAAVSRALEKRPAARWPSARAFAAALRHATLAPRLSTTTPRPAR
jgi:serine/threonine-protein kinase